jgi:transcriptional regulator with XRE-family HTH domain
MNIGDRIRAARLRAGITQRVLADRLGVDKSAVAQWEGGGGGKGIKTSNLVELARVLGIRPSELLSGLAAEDQLLLDDPEEIRLVAFFRRLPTKLQSNILETAAALAMRVTESKSPERIRHPANRRSLSA